MQEMNNFLNKAQLDNSACDSAFDTKPSDEGISILESCPSDADAAENEADKANGWASVYKKLRKIALLKKQAKTNRMWSSSTGDIDGEILENFRHLGADRTDNDVIESRMFEHSKNKFGFLDVARFIRATRKTGLNLQTDPRLTDTRSNLDACQNYIIENVDDENVNTGIDYNCFKGIISNNSDLLLAAYDGQLVIGDFDNFQSEIMKMHSQCAEGTDGGCTDYTDYLSEMDPNAWGVSICTIDGQRCSFGDSRQMFTMQALANPIIYAAVLSELGANAVHKLVGQEASGCHNKKIRLDKESRPHNPLINAGAILMSSQFNKNVSYSTRHNETLKMMRQAAGITNASGGNNASNMVGFDYAGFMAERATCHRNASICYFMREKHCFPDGDKTETNDVLDFYTQTQNVTVKYVCYTVGNSNNEANGLLTFENDLVVPEAP